MDKYQFVSSLLVRTPLLSSTGVNSSPACLLKKDEFKAALFLASRAFFNELWKRDFNYELLTGKQKQTVKKYMNRAAFRSTPFGLFSSVSLIPWAEECTAQVTLSTPKLHVLFDFAIAVDLWQQFGRKTFKEDTRFKTNPSLYSSGIDFRYIKKSTIAQQAQFSVVSVEKNPVLKSLLSFCKRPRTHREILAYLLSLSSDQTEAAEFITDLKREDLLIPATAPNVTGKDFLGIMAAHLPLAKKYMERLSSLHHYGELTDQLNTLSHELDNDLGRENTNYFYTISQRKTLDGGLKRDYQQSIREGLHCLQMLSSPAKKNDLETFKRAFIRQYEGDAVPLLEVMDAQFGIGYGGLDRPRVTYGFSSAGYRNSQPGGPPVIENDSAAFILKQWHRQTDRGFEIRITEQQLKALAKADSLSLPPSISVLFRTLDDKVVIESAGGASALPLLGRFSVFSEIDQYGKSIADREQALNKDIVFAEVTHLCNLHTANINRRSHFYDYEIPVLTHSTLPEDRQIQISDLVVAVKENNVVLFSRKLNKTVIPRLSSAFNYSKNDLPVFRFLCDLQNQGLKTHFGFSLSSLVPGLVFYPRIVYKSCILQLAEWHISPSEFRSDGNNLYPVVAFREKGKRLGLSRYFSYTIGDNFLVFDLKSDDDLVLFLSEIEGKETVVLKEFPFIGKEGIRNESEEPLIPQYMATLILQDEVYCFPNSNRRSLHLTKKSETSDWIYFKLYCHPLSSDGLLTKYLFPLVESLKKKKLISRWFWLRYNDPDYHLRIRVKTTGKSKGSVLKLFALTLSKACASKLVSHFQADTYKREIERYTAVLIDQVEQNFQASSEVVAHWLKEQNESNYEDRAMMLRAVESSMAALDAFGFTLPKKAALCKDAFDRFFTEFASPKTLKVEMERLFREVERCIDQEGSSRPLFEPLQSSIRDTVKQYFQGELKTPSLEKLAADLIHMHVNRLFIHEQRYFEMVHYFLLYRSLSKKLFKSGTEVR